MAQQLRTSTPRVATLVLCTLEGELLGHLPPFEVSTAWWQDAEPLVGWVRDHYGAKVTILRLLEADRPTPPGGSVTYLAELVEGQARTLPLARWADELNRHPLRLPYAEPGGPDADLAWVHSQLMEQGLRQTGPAQQVRTWNLSSLWRIPIEGSNAWLKCVPPFFAHEGAILARLQGAAVPRLLAHEPGRILMAEIPGEDQYDASDQTLLAMVSILVGLQQELSGRDADLLDVGLPDWRPVAMTALLESVVHRTGPNLHARDRRALHKLLAGLPQRFAALDECGIPNSLVHGDFAPGNARFDGRRLVLLDWGDCGVGHPLFDRSAFVDRIPDELVERVTLHWNELWRQAVPGSDPERAADILAPVAAARQAVIYQGFLDRIEPSEHPYHRNDPALWLTRAAELAAEAEL
jgi:Ser/Thr protein kinase RdoA (MazF antagonist)